MINSFRLNHFIKKWVFLLILFYLPSIYAQEYSVGLKAGGTYSFNDNGSELMANGDRFSAESGLGYLGGAFLEVNFGKWLVRPELFFNNAMGEFVISEATLEYSLDKISVPLLLGYNISGPIDIYAGPAYQVVLEKKLENTGEPLDKMHSNLAAQAGFKLRFNRWEIDIRYDFTFPSDDFQNISLNNISNTAYFDEGRLNQLMLSVNYKLFGSNIISARRRGSCY